MNQSFHTLKGITEKLLFPVLDYSNVRNTCAELAEFFVSISGFESETRESQMPLSVSSGHAISPAEALLCITDMMRTRNFIRGIKEAIDDRLSAQQGEPVRVFYAGTGPFAALLTPLITVFSPRELQMVLVEINPHSLKYLENTIRALEMEPYVQEILCTDAAGFSIPENLQPDILLSETMRPGLEKEPQVNIISALLPQCKRNPILVPESIRVDLLLTGNLQKDPAEKQFVESLLVLDARTAMIIRNSPEQLAVMGKGIRVKFRERPDPVFTTLQLDTSIRVYKEHRLGFNESGITIPKNMIGLSSATGYPATLLCRYSTTPQPGFTLTWINDAD